MNLPSLSEHASAIYMHLILHGATNEFTLAKSTGIHRIGVRAAIKELQKRKAITSKKQGARIFFAPNSPVFLEDLFIKEQKEKELTLRQLKQTFDEREKSVSSLGEITIHRGQEEIQTLFKDIVTSLGREGVFYRFIACGPNTDTESFVPPMYRPTRDAKSIQQIAITSAVMPGKPYKKGMGCLWKILPLKEDRFEHGTGQIVYGDKVAFIDYNQSIAYVIKNAAIAAMQISIHKALFSRLQERIT